MGARGEALGHRSTQLTEEQLRGGAAPCLRGYHGEMGGSGLILGIESSCDETAAAVVRGGREVLASVVASQMTLHAEYGGVVPELASREHLKNIVPVVREAMARAGVGFADLDAVAVTEGPGLAGALLVGITYAKALAAGLGKPLIGVNHLEGHIHAVLMEAGVEMDGPLMALVVSGGHSHLYLAEAVGGVEVLHPTRDDGTVTDGAPDDLCESAAVWRYRNVGRTVDDAAGEAFDKVAKLLGLGYPGGPWMDALAKLGNPRAVDFRFQPIRRRSANTVLPTHSAEDGARMGHPESKDKRRFPSGMTNNLPSGMTTQEMGNKEDSEDFSSGTTSKKGDEHFDFSFSGIKTAVLRYVQTHGMKDVVEARRVRLGATIKENPGLRADEAVREMPEVFDRQTLDLIASFQFAVVGNLLKQTFAAAEASGTRGVIVSGGVAANSELRRRFTEEAARRGMRVEFPALAMSTDNAAMIAAAAWGKFVAGDFAVDEMRASPGLRLG
jgi:tRNA N6-adenosine threonylcarbamoyltransferase